LLTSTFAEPEIASAKVFQIAIPAVNQMTKGISPFGAALKPTPKTSHRIKIIITGFKKVQKKPRIEPTCWVEMSRFAMSKTR